MTGRLALALALCLGGCLDWEPADDAVVAGEAEAPPLRNVTPAGLPPIALPGGMAERCHTVCLRYDECFGPAIDVASCESQCTAGGWVETGSDLACYLSRGCSELWMCHEE